MGLIEDTIIGIIIVFIIIIIYTKTEQIITERYGIQGKRRIGEW